MTWPWRMVLSAGAAALVVGLVGCSNSFVREADLEIKALRGSVGEGLRSQVEQSGAIATLRSIELGQLNGQPLRQWDGHSLVFDGEEIGRSNTFTYDADRRQGHAKFAFLVQVQRATGFVNEQKFVLACSSVDLTSQTQTPELRSVSCPQLAWSDDVIVQ